ncbi:MAG: chemotaxis protein CheX [Casimicrobiaceae bacterium]|nr:chemotaxis protein CheX [Casimicrobiaceae bacterium]MCX8099067.1 chemotaxis protein CheX [Casimicrobiaceae bacterium]MDW8312568.1 chemotaxis protein CheX [Burkholderiales bacterium]
MSEALLTERDVRVFVDALARFFHATTGLAATVRTAYRVAEPEPLRPGDLLGEIPVSGAYGGSIEFVAPRALLSHVLLRMGERDFSDVVHLDLVGEIANQVAGYARRVYGDALAIAPPRVRRLGPDERVLWDGPVFAVPLTWNDYEATLLVRLLPRAALANP